MASFNQLGFQYAPADLRVLEELASKARRFNGMEGFGGGDLRLAEAIEIGAWSGETTLHLAKFLPLVHAIGRWDQKHGGLSPVAAFQGFCRNMGDLLFNRIWPHVGGSGTYQFVWPRQSHLVVLHRPDAVDIGTWWHHVAPWGTLALIGAAPEWLKHFARGTLRSRKGSNVVWIDKADELVKLQREPEAAVPAAALPTGQD